MTIAEFKRRLAVGVKIHTLYHMQSTGLRDTEEQLVYTTKDLGVREVSKVQTNSFALATPTSKGLVNSWCTYPTKKKFHSASDKSVVIFEEARDGKYIPVLTYTFV